MTTYTITAEQSAAIVAQWNEYASEEFKIGDDQAYLILDDNFDSDLEADGQHLVEIGQHESADGSPHTFYIFESDVTAQEAIA